MIAAALIGLGLAAQPARVEEPPRAVKLYVACVTRSFNHPDEDSASADEAIEIAKSGCGNLRPAAVAAVRKRFGTALARMGDDPEVAAQAYLDILVDGPLEARWAELHGA